MTTDQISLLLGGRAVNGRYVFRDDRANITHARDQVWNTVFNLFDADWGGDDAGTLAQLAADAVAAYLILGASQTQEAIR